MKIYLKPIQFEDLKEEITIEIAQDKKVVDMIKEILKIYPIISSSLDFMFRGKKLISEKTLQEQNIKEGTKLMMYKSDLITIPNQPSKEQISNFNKENAKQKLIEMGFKIDLIESVIKTIANVDILSQDIIIEKSMIFLKSLKKETVSEYSIEIEEQKQSFIIDEEKVTSIFTMGDGIQGQLGIGKYIKTDFLMRVNKLRNLKIKMITCGVYHTVALTENGQVYFWGRYYWPLKLDEFTNKTDYKTGDTPSPLLLESLTNEFIVEIGCGSNHSLAINDKGEIFTWGEGIYGQLGHGDLNNEYYPRKIESLQNFRFKNVKGGATHSIAITYDDFVFGWGSNEKNQLNLKGLKFTTSPLLLTLYDLIGNYTIEEIRNLNLDQNFNLKNLKDTFNDLNKQNLLNYKQINELEFPVNLENDFSYNLDDLMKIKLFDCGTWFTVFTSQMFPNILYLFGNFLKNVIKLTYFEENKLEIKQISASNYQICVLTVNNQIYKININDLQKLKSRNEAEKLELEENFEIDKIGCGFNYLLILTNNKQGILNQNYEKNKFIYLNSETKSDFNEIFNGPFHFFLQTSLKSLSLGDYLFDKINDYTNNYNLGDINPDLYLKPNDNNFMLPCHSIFIDQFLNTENKINKIVTLPINLEQILILLELIYTANLKILFKEESKKIMDNPEILQNLQNNLKEIIIFLRNEMDINKNIELLLNLVNLYSEKIKNILNYERVSQEYEKFMVSKKISQTLNIIMQNKMNIEIKDLNIPNNVINNLDNNFDNDEDEDNMNNIHNQNYFEKFENKGTKILSNLISDEYDHSRFNLNDYLNSQNKLIDPRYQFNSKIVMAKEQLINSIENYIKNNKNDELNLNIKIENKNSKQSNKSDLIKINKLYLNFKSLYFNNFIKIQKNDNNINNDSLIFNLDLNQMIVSEKSLENMFKFLNNEKIKLPIEGLFEMLDLANYFMIDNLYSLLEIEMEGITNLENVLCLLEVSKDYALTFLRRSCLFYLMLNLNEAKNKSIFKFIKEDDMIELKRLLALNNK